MCALDYNKHCGGIRDSGIYGLVFCGICDNSSGCEDDLTYYIILYIIALI